jgi:hypothetical protein
MMLRDALFAHANTAAVPHSGRANISIRYVSGFPRNSLTLLGKRSSFVAKIE